MIFILHVTCHQENVHIINTLFNSDALHLVMMKHLPFVI